MIEVFRSEHSDVLVSTHSSDWAVFKWLPFSVAPYRLLANHVCRGVGAVRKIIPVADVLIAGFALPLGRHCGSQQPTMAPNQGPGFRRNFTAGK